MHTIHKETRRFLLKGHLDMHFMKPAVTGNDVSTGRCDHRQLMDLMIEKYLLAKACFGTDTFVAPILIIRFLFTYKVYCLLHAF